MKHPNCDGLFLSRGRRKPSNRGAARRTIRRRRIAGPAQPAHLRATACDDQETTVPSQNRFLDDFARLMTDAAGAAQGMRREAETMMRAQV